MPITTLRLTSDSPSPAAIEGVIVEFYTLGGTLETQGTTDASGEVSVTLPLGFHDIYFYKPGVVILPKQPQRIEVLNPPASNLFLVTGHVIVPPESIDSRRCTVSGHILGANGLPTRTKLVFTTAKDLLVLDGQVIAPDLQVNAESNENGYFEFELLRGQSYCAYFVFLSTFLGTTPGSLDVRVPNAPSVSIGALLFPLPVDMAFSSTVLSIAVDDGLNDTIEYTLTYSDGSTRVGTGSSWGGISLSNTNNTVVDAKLLDGKLVLTPLSPGVATITTSRSISTRAFFDPEPTYTTQEVVVTVT